LIFGNFFQSLLRDKLPNKVTLLRSVIKPAEGGETHFLDTITAYEELPEDYKNRLRGKSALYSYLKFRTADEVPGVSAENRIYLLILRIQFQFKICL
jgi:alpha-ketoglutarate-dependent taurine dioxygenase